MDWKNQYWENFYATYDLQQSTNAIHIKILMALFKKDRGQQLKQISTEGVVLEVPQNPVSNILQSYR